MEQERHYKVGKSLILDGTIKTFGDIFEYVPKSTVAKDLKMHFNTFQSRLNHTGTFSIQELTTLAELLAVDPMVIITLAFADFNHNRKAKKKK